MQSSASCDENRTPSAAKRLRIAASAWLATLGSRGGESASPAEGCSHAASLQRKPLNDHLVSAFKAAGRLRQLEPCCCRCQRLCPATRAAAAGGGAFACTRAASSPFDDECKDKDMTERELMNCAAMNKRCERCCRRRRAARVAHTRGCCSRNENTRRRHVPATALISDAVVPEYGAASVHTNGERVGELARAKTTRLREREDEQERATKRRVVVAVNRNPSRRLWATVSTPTPRLSLGSPLAAAHQAARGSLCLGTHSAAETVAWWYRCCQASSWCPKAGRSSIVKSKECLLAARASHEQRGEKANERNSNIKQSVQDAGGMPLLRTAGSVKSQTQWLAEPLRGRGPQCLLP